MAVSTVATPMDASLVPLTCGTLNSTTLVPPAAPCSVADPTVLFGMDYNNCNGILSATTPSTITVPSPKSNTAMTSSKEKKRKALSSQKKGGRKKKNSTTTTPSSSPCCVIYTTASLAARIVSSEAVAPTVTTANPNARITVIPSPLDGLLDPPEEDQNKKGR